MRKLKLFTLIALLSIGAYAANAQNDQKKDVKKVDGTMMKHNQDKKMMRGHGDYIYKDLELTESQKAQIKEIRGKRANEKKDLQDKIKAIHQAERKEIEQILTEEQNAKLQKKREEFKTKKGEFKKKNRNEKKSYQKKNLD